MPECQSCFTSLPNVWDGVYRWKLCIWVRHLFCFVLFVFIVKRFLKGRPLTLRAIQALQHTKCRWKRGYFLNTQRNKFVHIHTYDRKKIFPVLPWRPGNHALHSVHTNRSRRGRPPINKFTNLEVATKLTRCSSCILVVHHVELCQFLPILF